jgi:metal-responsive CopG/Arc/MetJ family transcriptional regulator
MASTSVHFPGGLLEELDYVAATLGISRNRLIVDSCEQTVRRRRQWPEGFFTNDHLSAD